MILGIFFSKNKQYFAFKSYELAIKHERFFDITQKYISCVQINLKFCEQKINQNSIKLNFTHRFDELKKKKKLTNFTLIFIVVSIVE